MPATTSSFTMPAHSSAHLQRLCERVADWLQAAASGALPLLARAMEDAAARTVDARECSDLRDLAGRLRVQPVDRARRVRRIFEQQVRLHLEGGKLQHAGRAGGPDGAFPPAASGPELVRAACVEGASVCGRYAARLDHLLAECGAPWRDRDNPLAVEAMAAALQAALDGLAADASARRRLELAAQQEFLPVLLEVIEAAERLLAQMGYTGSRTDSQPGGAASIPGTGSTFGAGLPPDVASAVSGDPLVDHLQALVVRAEDDAATLGTSALARDPDGARLRSLPVLHPVLDAERDAVAFAHSVGALPYSREARAGFFMTMRKRLLEASAPTAQVAVVDLVAAMFDYLVGEDRVPLAARPLLWRLQLPVLSLSLLDAGYLGEDPRSLRRLLEHFGAISTHHADEITRGSELHRRLETVVRAIEIVASALQTRSSVMAQQVQKEFARAARSVGQVIEHVVREYRTLEATPGRRNRRNYVRRPGPELEQEFTGKVRHLLEDRLRRHQAPESVRRFLMDLWLRHLRTAALRDGEHSAAFQVSLNTVDDLLWSLDEQGQPFSRRELAQRIPPLIRLMNRGVHEIGAREEDYKAFFDELFLIHLRRMQKRDREHGAVKDAGHGNESPGSAGHVGEAARRQSADPDPTAAAAAAAVPEREPDAGEHLSGILASLDLGDLPASPECLRIDADAAISRLTRGDWIEWPMRDGARSWLKVAWINRRRTVVLLLRHGDRRASSLRMDELRDRLARGRACLIRTKAETAVRSIGDEPEKTL